MGDRTMRVFVRTSSSFPSPFGGEGAERTRSVSEAGKGPGLTLRADPSPGRSLRSRPRSPTRGEGKEVAR
jgi:hypothetical protein